MGVRGGMRGWGEGGGGRATPLAARRDAVCTHASVGTYLRPPAAAAAPAAAACLRAASPPAATVSRHTTGCRWNRKGQPGTVRRPASREAANQYMKVIWKDCAR